MAFHQQQNAVQECLSSLCPQGVAGYAAMHLDSIGKILHHLVLAMAVLNGFLWLSSWSAPAAKASEYGLLNASFIAFLLVVQNVLLYVILNNDRLAITFPSVSFLAPTEFILGVALGITIGAAILSFVLSQSFRRFSTNCRATTSSSTLNNDDNEYSFSSSSLPLCTSASLGGAGAIWFWAGLVFWLNFWASLLLAVGRRELAYASSSSSINNPYGGTQQYEPIGTSESQPTGIGGPSNSYHQQHQQQPTIGGGGQFVGDYATVPEIRGGTSPQQPASQTSPITQSV